MVKNTQQSKVKCYKDICEDMLSVKFHNYLPWYAFCLLNFTIDYPGILTGRLKTILLKICFGNLKWFRAVFQIYRFFENIVLMWQFEMIICGTFRILKSIPIIAWHLCYEIYHVKSALCWPQIVHIGVYVWT